MALTFKKGDSVLLHGFTGMKLGVYKVTGATKTEITIEKADGTELVFSRKTGKQLNVAEGKERYANYITEDDGSYENPLEKARKSSKKSSKKASSKAKKAEEVEEDIDEDDEEEAPKKPAKKAKKSSKKPAKKVVEDDDDEFEEDEYEEDEE